MAESYGEAWCDSCPEPANGPDGKCGPHREGVPVAVTDPWLAAQFLQNLRRRRAKQAAHDARVEAARAAHVRKD